MTHSSHRPFLSSLGWLSAVLFLLTPASASAGTHSLSVDGADSFQPTYEESSEPVDWTRREVRHLLNRAAFGARMGTIDHWVRMGQEALIDDLFDLDSDDDGYYIEHIDPYDRARLKGLKGEPRRKEVSRLRELDRQQGRDFLIWWVEEMAKGDAPLRERMTLFWHGLFTSGLKTIKRAYPMVDQNQLFREHALGSYADLLAEVMRDPAMLRYLDNDSNTRESPNENLAREVMELFSLGEGNYSERDVQEAARALTGRGLKDGRYHFGLKEHDFGRKVILGHRGRHDANDLVNILLQDEACPRYIASRLIEHFEGIAPSEARLTSYAYTLRDESYQIEPFLRRLFADPEFYRDEIVGARVASPIDFLVGTCVRLRMPVPSRFVLEGAGITGMRLFQPPNVKGWEGGLAWIDSGSLMARGNLIGLLLGTFDGSDLSNEEELPALEAHGLAFATDSQEEAMSAAPSIDEVMMDEAMMSEEGFDESMMEMDFFDEPMMGSQDAMMSDGLDLEVMQPSSVVGTATDDGADAPPTKKKREKSLLQKLATNMSRYGYRPRVYLTRRLISARIEGDAEIVRSMLEALLAIEPPAETYRLVERYLQREREAAGLPEGQLLLGGAASEPILRRLAHLILSLPEAQLH